MSVSKPGTVPEWASNGPGVADITTPSGTKKGTGWLVEKPPHDEMNWLQYWAYKWFQYVNDPATFGTLAATVFSALSYAGRALTLSGGTGIVADIANDGGLNPALRSVNGAAFASSNAAVPAVDVTGNQTFGGTNPASTVGITNTLNRATILKAWGRATGNGSGGVTVNDGINIASVVKTSAENSLTVTLQNAMADTNYAIFPGAGANFIVSWTILSTTQFKLFPVDLSGTGLDPTVSGRGITFQVHGKQ